MQHIPIIMKTYNLHLHFTAGGSGVVHHLDPNTNIISQPTDTKGVDRAGGNNEVVIMSEDDRTTSFFAQPGILAGK